MRPKVPLELVVSHDRDAEKRRDAHELRHVSPQVTLRMAFHLAEFSRKLARAADRAGR